MKRTLNIKTELLMFGFIVLISLTTFILQFNIPDDRREKFKHKKDVVHIPEANPKNRTSEANPKNRTLLLETLPKTDEPTNTDEPTVMLGMATHDRPGYVQLTLKALKESTHRAKIFIFDDASTKMSTSELYNWMGDQAETVTGLKTKRGPDAMARHILEKFVSSKFDVLVLLDSDQVVAPTWWSSLQKGLRKSTGLLSLYRSGAPKHKSLSCDAVLCRMPSMGNAGTVWRRALAKRMLSEMPNRDGGFDWGWSEWCAKNKVPMEALKESAVLHIGMYGSWSHESSAEKSVGFPMGELSVDVRQQAEHFLKGAKPTESTNKKLPNHYDKVSIGEVPDILWVIPAFKRAWSLQLVLKSLASQNNILVSKDADSDEIDSVLKKYSVNVISHPWSCSRHPNQFPAKDESLNENYKGDTYGNPRSPWATCLKHHWWWMMKQAWARKPERVCVLEDDTVIHPQAFEWLASHSGNVKLTPEEIAVPWCMSAKEWQTIEPKAFCEHDDYNWDQTIAWMKEHGHGQNEASVPSVSLSMHVGDCGGWDAGGRDKACTPQKIVKIHANVEHWLGKSIPVHIVKRKWLTAHSKPNGGWGHPKDWAHCLGNDESKPFGMHFLERLEYYLPNRDYLFPTDVKSIEKKILTFDIPNHVSITFDAPVENIAISTKNWPEKHKTQCPNCEFVNDRSATVKWVPGCPSNPRKDYKEQILVCSCGESQKGTGSSYFNSGIHKCDYDASFLNHDFQDAYSHLHLTPPQYKKILTVSNEMERYLEMPPMQEDKAVFIHSDCGHERGTFVSKMIQEGIFPIDRYGKCWRNKDIKTIEPSREKWYWGDSQGNRDTTKTDVFTGYKFSFALENTKSRDYFTEKRYQSFLALTVPIVWKNDNSEQYTPGENSVIYPEDHDNDPTELAKYLLRLTTDDKAYQKHMAWKKKGIRREFVKTLFKKTDFMACRICEKVSKKTKSIKYVVVIPSVKRNNDEYLIKTLDSLERARPADVPVLLVNANQPATKHTYLREWCSSHEKYKCINPPKVPESLIKDAISNDKRGDTPQYLRWRTMEAMHAMFGMTEFLKTGAEYMVWLQDDVTVDEDLFSSLPDEEIVCLRSDGYCGMVAYMFKKSFVQKLIPRLERDYKDMPIDWIVDKTRGKDVVRIPKAYHHGIKSSNGKIRHKTKNEQITTSKQVATIPTLDKSMQNVIKTSDLFAAIDYNAPENKGPWKQGWDYDYDGRFKDGLTVHVVPHSHNDPGWIKTYHTYYSTQTKHILDTVVAALTEDPRRTFIWAEISYFSLWWDDATQQQKEQAKKLVAEKRLDFVTGGWVMNDEASVTARATRWHLQEGREWLQNTFGITPQYSWAIDPFGHSAGQAQVLKELGYKGMLIQRVHYAVKKQLAQKQQLEFQWQTPAGEIFTHMMPFYSYDGPHTCGPDPSVCCQFDFARIGKGKTWTGCPWGKMAVEITEHNVAERSKKWLDQVYKKAMLYRGKHVLVPVGDDFRYQTMDEAHKQFTNYQRMFDWIKINVPSVKASFSTLTQYFDVAVQTQVPKLQGSFFPYSDREKDYWTGYFNSRIFYKGYDRLLESLIAAVETKCPTVDVHLQKRALGLFQHHDGITGTAKSHVVQDYYQTMQKAVTELKTKLKTCLDIAAGQLVNPLSVETPTMKADEIRPYEEDACVSVPAAGLQFVGIKIDEHGNIIQINDTPIHESLVWRSNKPGQGVAGAYLMSVTYKEDILQPIKHTTCIAKMYKQVDTTFDMLKKRIRVYNDGTIEFIYDVDIHARNNGELWAVYKPEWTAERLCSDVHGLTWECHTERKDAPLQAKFWPMPTMAWLASSSGRMTFTGAQPTGVGFHEGAMVLMLDRRGDQDDARGLGQGITDSRPVEMRFGVVMESEISAKHASTKALAIRNWMLNPEIVLHGPSQNVLQNSKRPPKFITFLKNILLQNKLDVKELNGKLKVSQTSTTKTFKCTIDVEKINLKQTKKWSDIFETNPNSLVGSTPFTVDEIKEIQKRSLLPKDDVPIYIIARDNKNVDTGGATIIRFNSHDNEKRTTMRFTWGQHLSDFVHKFNEGPQKLIKWVHPPYMVDYGFWNTSSPLVVPRNQWKLNQLRQTLKAQTPLYFLKSSIWSGKKSWMVDCPLVDGVGALVTGILIELKAPKMLVGVSTTSDEYNFYDNNVGEPTLRNRWRLMLYNNIFNALLKYK